MPESIQITLTEDEAKEIFQVLHFLSRAGVEAVKPTLAKLRQALEESDV